MGPSGPAEPSSRLLGDAARSTKYCGPGAFARGTTLDMLTWVAEKRYENQDAEDFQRYHARRIRERNDGTTD